MIYRAIVGALSLLFVAVVGSMFYMVRPPTDSDSSSEARGKASAEARVPTNARSAGQPSSGSSVRETVERNREGRRRLSRNTERMLESLETDAELRRRGGERGETWAPSGGGWGR